MIAVASSTHQVAIPRVIQDYVCAELQGSRDMTGSDAAHYLAGTAKVQGATGSQIVAATKGYPFIPASQQLFWLGSAKNDVNSPIVKAYVQTGQFLVGQGSQLGPDGRADRAAHRPHLRQEGARRCLPELTPTAASAERGRT